MTGGKLRYTVAVRHPETGDATALVAGSEVPEWAADLVHADDLEGKAEPKQAPAPAKKAEPAPGPADTAKK